MWHPAGVHELRRLLRRKPFAAPTRVEGEEYEIAKAEEVAQNERDRFAESLIEKAGHARYPFLKDPFE